MAEHDTSERRTAGGGRSLEGFVKLLPLALAVLALGSYSLTRASQEEVRAAEQRAREAAYPRKDGERLERAVEVLTRQTAETAGDVKAIRALLEREGRR